MQDRVTDNLRGSGKSTDVLWKRHFARPVAAWLLIPLARTAVTPNQLTLASLLVFVFAMVILVLAGGLSGLLVGIGVLQVSYVLDAADGQLARLRNISTPVGAHLDFLMDELKALLLVSGISVRLWRGDGQDLWLLEGVLGIAFVGAGLMLTTFVRRPEYVAATHAERNDADDAPSGPKPRGAAVRLAEIVGRFIIHYPGPIVAFAALNRMDIFLHIYLAANAAHTGRTLLAILMKLGRRPRVAAPEEAPAPLADADATATDVSSTDTDT